MSDPFEYDINDGWHLERGWQIVGWCEAPPMWDRNPNERYYVGLMLEAPDGNDYWWHWMLARGVEAIKDWRASEWPMPRHPKGRQPAGDKKQPSTTKDTMTPIKPKIETKSIKHTFTPEEDE